MDTGEPHVEVPLVWTTKGNVPIASLEHFVQWEHTDDYVKFREVYKTPQGETVKETCHILKLRGTEAIARQADID